MPRALRSGNPASAAETEQSRRDDSHASSTRRMRFARSPWGDQTLEQRMPSFLEAALFEPEAEVPAREHGALTHRV